MSDVFGVFRFLSLRTMKNRVSRQLRRLREPRYLIPTAVSLLWIGFWSSNVLRSGLRDGHSSSFQERWSAPGALDAFAVAGGIVLVLWTAFLWLLPSKSPVLEFTRSEIHFLFPAPVTRRQIVHYKLLSAQLGIFFGAFVTSFFWGRGLTTFGGWGRLFAIWLLYVTLHLHTLGAGFLFTDLVEQGVSGLRRRIVPFVGLVVFIVLAVIGVREGWPQVVTAFRGLGGDFDDMSRGALGDFLGTIGRIGTTGALGVVLAPFMVFPRLILAQSPAEYLRWLPFAVVVLLAHYLWVIRADAAFEEAAVEAAQKRAARVEAAKTRARHGGSAPKSVRPFPWKLAASGRPGIALLWKNLVYLSRVTPVRALIGLGAFLFGMVGLVAGLNEAGAPVGLVLAFLTALIALFTAVFGPVFLRNDLREDLLHLDVVKTLPLSGRAIVRGEILAPWVVLAGIQLAALAASSTALVWVGTAALGTLGLDAIPEAGWWFAGITAAAFILPAVTGIQLALQNAIVLLFPAWVALANTRARGFEASGQRMLTVLGSGLALALFTLPALASGGIAAWLLAGVIGAPSVVIGAVIAAGWLLAEVWWATRFLGGVFDRLDPSTAGIEAPESS